DPQWTLHAAAEQGYSGPAARWPDPFAAGRRKPQTGRTDGPRPRLELVRAGLPGTAHARWRPRADPGGPGPDGEASQHGEAGSHGEAGPDRESGPDDGAGLDGAAAAPVAGGERWRPSP